MTNLANSAQYFECRIRSIDNLGRSKSLWIPISTCASLDDAKEDGLAELEKQREDADSLQIQIVDHEDNILLTMSPPHREWQVHYQKEKASEPGVTQEELESLNKKASLAILLSSAALFSSLIISLALLLNIDKII